MNSPVTRKRACLLCGFILLITSIPGVLSSSGERKLLEDLFYAYNRMERPVANESEAISLRFGLTLQQIMDVDEKNQLITTNVWLNMEWTDDNLRWNESEYGNVRDLRIPPS